MGACEAGLVRLEGGGAENGGGQGILEGEFGGRGVDVSGEGDECGGVEGADG